MKMNSKSIQLANLLMNGLDKQQAHITFENAVKDIPFEYTGKIVEGIPYSIWQLVEHLRIAQYDILDFSRNKDYQLPQWPEDYWPKEKAPKNEAQWHQSLTTIKKDKSEFMALLANTQNHLYAPFPHSDGQNLIREALLIIDHNAYHTGQIILLRRALGVFE